MQIQGLRPITPQAAAPAADAPVAGKLATQLRQTENRPAASGQAQASNPLDGLCVRQTLECFDHPQTRRQLGDSALLANFPYSRDLDSLKHTQWRPDTELARLLAKGGKLEYQPQQARLLDPDSGLVAYVFRNRAEGEIRLVFGGTTSGRGVGDLAPRNLKNIGSVTRQWRANISNAVFGGRPACYRQAAQLTHKLQQLAAGLPLMRAGEPAYTVSTGGHSLGGGMAAYAAMKLSTPQSPIRAECFSSAQFGRGLQRELLAQHGGDQEQARAASADIRHYCVKGDIVPALDGLLSVRHVGQLYQLPADHGSDDSRLGRHDKFLDHVRDFVASTREGKSKFYA
ncbi:lipase family protein [Chromobacterium vaccinii]|uniref:lipase family protein n=1 Tax=Chromobacterium vaccinii TaxID=1108595 RepID=UPI003C732D65